MEVTFELFHFIFLGVIFVCHSLSSLLHFDFFCTGPSCTDSVRLEGVSVWMSRNLKSDSESEYKPSYKPRRGIDREPYSLRRQPDGVKIEPQFSEEGDDAYSSAYSEETPMAMTNETLSQMIQMLMADKEKDRADRERATEERLRQQEKDREERERERQERLQQQQRYERREEESRKEAAHERERQETFLRNMQERQAIQTERIQKAADTTQYITMIPAMTEGQDSEEYVTNLEKLLHQNNVPEEKWRQILSTKITPVVKAVVAEHFDDATCTFQDIRDALLRCKGLTSIKAISHLYSQTISVDTAIPMITINKVDKWVSTVCKGVTTLAEMKNRWVTSRILAVLNP